MVRFVNSKTESVDLFKLINTLITPVQINLSQNSNILYIEYYHLIPLISTTHFIQLSKPLGKKMLIPAILTILLSPLLVIHNRISNFYIYGVHFYIYIYIYFLRRIGEMLKSWASRAESSQLILLLNRKLPKVLGNSFFRNKCRYGGLFSWKQNECFNIL